MPVYQWHNDNRLTLYFSLNATRHAKMGASTPSYDELKNRKFDGMISFVSIRVYSWFKTILLKYPTPFAGLAIISAQAGQSVVDPLGNLRKEDSEKEIEEQN